MAVTVSVEAEDTTTTDGNVQTLFTEDTAGSFYVLLDLDDMAAADEIEIDYLIQARDSTTQRSIEGFPVRYLGSLAPGIVRLPTFAIPANYSLAVTIQRVAGSDFDVPWSEIEIG